MVKSRCSVKEHIKITEIRRSIRNSVKKVDHWIGLSSFNFARMTPKICSRQPRSSSHTAMRSISTLAVRRILREGVATDVSYRMTGIWCIGLVRVLSYLLTSSVVLMIAFTVNILHENLSVPVTAKFRVFPEVEKTVEYAKMIERAGAQILTCHGRIREQRGQNSVR